MVQGKSWASHGIPLGRTRLQPRVEVAPSARRGGAGRRGPPGRAPHTSTPSNRRRSGGRRVPQLVAGKVVTVRHSGPDRKVWPIRGSGRSREQGVRKKPGKARRNPTDRAGVSGRYLPSPPPATPTIAAAAITAAPITTAMASAPAGTAGGVLAHIFARSILAGIPTRPATDAGPAHRHTRGVRNRRIEGLAGRLLSLPDGLAGRLPGAPWGSFRYSAIG